MRVFLIAATSASLLVAAAAIPVAAVFFQHASIEGVLKVAFTAAFVAGISLLAGRNER